MKAFFSWLGEKLLVVLAFIILSIIMGIGHLGLVWLAGDTDEPSGLSVMFFLWPVALLLTFITLIFDFGRRNGVRSYYYEPSVWKSFSFWRPGLITGIWLAYYLSPILLNLVSEILKLVGWNVVAQTVFDYRWLVHPVLPFALLAILVFVGVISSCVQWIKDRFGSKQVVGL